MNNLVIDFQALRKQEKKRAKQKLKHTKQQTASSSATLISPNDTAIVPSEAAQPQVFPTWQEEITLDGLVPTALDADRHCVCRNPPTIYCIPNYLPPHWVQPLQAWLLALPQRAEGEDPHGGWTRLPYAQRRVALLDAAQQPLPEPIARLAQALTPLMQFTPNHVLINEYQAGQGILPHTDGPLYKPCTATLSLGGSVLLNFTPRNNNSDLVCQVLLESATLVIFQDKAYTDHCHGIAVDTLQEAAHETRCVNAPAHARTLSREYRISLTFRQKLDLPLPACESPP